MALIIPATTQSILQAFEADQLPTVDYEIAEKLSGLHNAEGLTDAERKGAWAEATAFHFMPIEDCPWGTHYGPISVLTTADGTPIYVPDIAVIDEEIVAYWEDRVEAAQHPVLRARYADLVWDLKKKTTGKLANVLYAQRAIDAYLDGITASLYTEPLIHAVQAGGRALELALSINDNSRVKRCKQVLLSLFDQSLQPRHIGVWATLFDTLTQSKKVALAADEMGHLVQGLEAMLTSCATLGDQFDPGGAEAAGRRLASHYERQGNKGEVQRAIRSYCKAFEQLAAQANSTLAMGWLQPIYDEYKNRGMHEDAERVQAASVEKGKNAAADLKQIRVPVGISEAQVEQLAKDLTQGSPHDALLRIAGELIPKAGKIKALLQEMLTTAPLMARIGVTRIVGDHFAAQAGSIEEDPERRLIMELAQHIEFYNFLLCRTLDQLRAATTITSDTILAVLDESPVFTPERRPLLEEGVKAYLDGDHTKAIHIIIPQIEQALRQLLALMRVPVLKSPRNGVMQLKNLNDILREPAIKQALGDDIRLYLQTFLADERGQNIRNTVCHGLAAPSLFNRRLADQALHALLTVSLVRQKVTEPPPDEKNTPPSPSDSDEATQG